MDNNPTPDPLSVEAMKRDFAKMSDNDLRRCISGYNQYLKSRPMGAHDIDAVFIERMHQAATEVLNERSKVDTSKVFNCIIKPDNKLITSYRYYDVRLEVITDGMRNNVMLNVGQAKELRDQLNAWIEQVDYE